MDEAELSQIVSEQLRLLGGQIGRAVNLPSVMKPLLVEGEAVVLLRMYRGQLRLDPYEEIFVVKAENTTLQKKIKEQKEEIKSLNLLLEEQKQPEIEDIPELSTDESDFFIEPKPEPKKKKRRCKTKAKKR